MEYLVTSGALDAALDELAKSLPPGVPLREADGLGKYKCDRALARTPPRRSPPSGPSVLGLEAGLADGRAVRLGGPRLKDVAGLSLTRLFVGSEGTSA